MPKNTIYFRSRPVTDFITPPAKITDGQRRPTLREQGSNPILSNPDTYGRKFNFWRCEAYGQMMGNICMAPTLRRLCRIFMVAELTGNVIVLPTSAYAKSANGRETIDYSARSRMYLGSHAWVPGGGDLRWNYGPGINWYWTHPYEHCYLRRRIFVNRRGHRIVKWV